MHHLEVLECYRAYRHPFSGTQRSLQLSDLICAWAPLDPSAFDLGYIYHEGSKQHKKPSQHTKELRKLPTFWSNNHCWKLARSSMLSRASRSLPHKHESIRWRINHGWECHSCKCNFKRVHGVINVQFTYFSLTKNSLC